MLLRLVRLENAFLGQLHVLVVRESLTRTSALALAVVGLLCRVDLVIKDHGGALRRLLVPTAHTCEVLLSHVRSLLRQLLQVLVFVDLLFPSSFIVGVVVELLGFVVFQGSLDCLLVVFDVDFGVLRLVSGRARCVFLLISSLLPCFR